MIWDEKISEEIQHRLTVFGWICFLIFTLLVVRLWYLSVFQEEWYKEKSERNWLRIIPLQALRGSIYDRYGKVLAEDLPRFRLVLLEGSMDVKEAQRKVKEILGEEIGFQVKDMSPGEKVLIEDLPLEKVIKIEERREELPGILVESYSHRFYPAEEVLAHVIGYVGRITAEELKNLSSSGYEVWDTVGKGGIELFYESLLRGEKGYRKVGVDALGRVRSVLEHSPARLRNSLVLTVDLEFQEYCYHLLQGKRGTIIVGRPTGEILVLASQPSFDPNTLSGGLTTQEWSRLVQSEKRPFTNRATQALYPPGSIFKLVVALAGLEEKVISARTSFSCPGFLEYSGKRYYCWNRAGHGSVNVERALAHSCNVFFYNVALALGPEKIVQYAQKFGLGTPSGLDIPGEKASLLPTPLWKRQNQREMWYPGDTLNLAIGQGYLLMTPFEVYRLLCGVATRGKIYRPHFLQAVLNREGKLIREVTPVLEREVNLRGETWDLLLKGMELVVTQGTGYACRDVPVNIAAKTGTAQNPHGKDHSWFGGFFPVDQPRVVFLVMLENSGDGSGEAAHAARRLIDWFLKYRGLTDEER